MDAWPPSDGEAIHTSTFLGNPLACAAAVAALTVLQEEGLAARSGEVGSWWKDRLESALSGIPTVGEVRGRGLMVGVDLVDPGAGERAPNGALGARVVVEALQRGWILLPGGPEGNVLSLTPPLTTPLTLLDDATEMLAEVIPVAG